MARGISIAGVGIPAMSVSVQANRNPLFEESIGLPTQSKVYGGTYSVSGSVTAAYRPSTLATVSAKVFGQAVTSGISLSTIPVADTKLAVIVQDDDGNNSEFRGCAVTGMELTLNSNEYAKVTYNWIGRNRASSPTSPAAASFTNSLALFYNAELSFGGSVITAKGFSMKIDRPLTPDHILGTEYACSLVQSGQLTVTGTLTLTSEQYDLLEDAFTTGDEAAAEDGGTYDPASTHENTIQSGEIELLLYDDTIPTPVILQRITIEKAHITEGSQSASGRNPWDKTVNWVAEVSDDNNVILASS